LRDVRIVPLVESKVKQVKYVDRRRANMDNCLVAEGRIFGVPEV
jgi:hypothetical protein